MRLMKIKYLVQSVTIGWLVALQPFWVSTKGSVVWGIFTGMATWFVMVCIDQIKRDRRKANKKHQQSYSSVDADALDTIEYLQSLL